MTFRSDEPVFQISVVARMVGVHQQTLRSYEREGFIQPHRTSGNTRLYSQRDVERLQQVLRSGPRPWRQPRRRRGDHADVRPD